MSHVQVTMWGVTAEYKGEWCLSYAQSLMETFKSVQPHDKDQWVRLCVIHTHPLPGASVRPYHWWDLPTHILINQATHSYKHQQFVGSKERP